MQNNSLKPLLCTDDLIAVFRSNAAFLMLIVAPIVGFCSWYMFCCALRCVHSSFAVILMGKKELVDLLSLPSWCLLIVVLLFLVVP